MDYGGGDHYTADQSCGWQLQRLQVCVCGLSLYSLQAAHDSAAATDVVIYKRWVLPILFTYHYSHGNITFVLNTHNYRPLNRGNSCGYHVFNVVYVTVSLYIVVLTKLFLAMNRHSCPVLKLHKINTLALHQTELKSETIPVDRPDQARPLCTHTTNM